ncbi:voltage-gated chloride channel family protein [Paraflavitalea sp. CAU 1676]|uniref:voltage-gated chloride channel family protein n=1 Tax=Paraflavitalea sp. CAU 1676 TaxID=3032598 RepID=UPI0023DAD689|nr:voltage-gated chloride channel family protein [Paraflavitalea sp. CAU 1676]MDF2190478.1 voltage-gated chloride channel family protein [Paraflavitalea sp. CAU 1676]
MKKALASFEQVFIVRHLLKWTLIAIPVALVTASLVALFLWLLDVVTGWQWQQGWLLYLLPLAGIGIYLLYKLYGKDAEKGNNLIMEEIHEPGGGVPVRMAPLVLVTTLITHLFGGSAGREGTAVQMGGSMASLLGKWFKLPKEDVRIILMMGIAAGFGAVFGTPLTGAIFALEVLAIGRIKYDALIPCLIAAVFADIVCSAWGIQHTSYYINLQPSLTHEGELFRFQVYTILKVVVAGIAYGLAAWLFIQLLHLIKAQMLRLVPGRKWLIPVIGGVAIIVLTLVLGTRDYLGLGVISKNLGGVSITNAFNIDGVHTWSWWWKLLFTAITLGCGFKGGEVTPLFFIGAALGNTLATLMGAPVDLFAGLGFIAVFAAATNTPIACTLMGVELFGTDNALYYAIACFTAYYFSGHAGIYSAQRTAVAKTTYTNK